MGYILGGEKVFRVAFLRKCAYKESREVLVRELLLKGHV